MIQVELNLLTYKNASASYILFLKGLQHEFQYFGEMLINFRFGKFL